MAKSSQDAETTPQALSQSPVVIARGTNPAKDRYHPLYPHNANAQWPHLASSPRQTSHPTTRDLGQAGEPLTPEHIASHSFANVQDEFLHSSVYQEASGYEEVDDYDELFMQQAFDAASRLVHRRVAELRELDLPPQDRRPRQDVQRRLGENTRAPSQSSLLTRSGALPERNHRLGVVVESSTQEAGGSPGASRLRYCEGMAFTPPSTPRSFVGYSQTDGVLQMNHFTRAPGHRNDRRVSFSPEVLHHSYADEEPIDKSASNPHQLRDRGFGSQPPKSILVVRNREVDYAGVWTPTSAERNHAGWERLGRRSQSGLIQSGSSDPVLARGSRAASRRLVDSSSQVERCHDIAGDVSPLRRNPVTRTLLDSHAPGLEGSADDISSDSSSSSNDTIDEEYNHYFYGQRVEIERSPHGDEKGPEPTAPNQVENSDSQPEA